jgi:hypothetical protein
MMTILVDDRQLEVTVKWLAKDTLTTLRMGFAVWPFHWPLRMRCTANHVQAPKKSASPTRRKGAMITGE